VEFGKHLGKGIWGIADKSLPVVYGLAYVLLVIRVLPEEEFGNFVLIQELFLIVSGLATAFALNPLLKFASEDATDQAQVITASLLLNLAFNIVASALVVAFRAPFSDLLQSPNLAALMLYLPAMLAASFVRNFALMLLQTRFLVERVFWTDAVHFLGVPLLIWVYSKLHLFDSALDLIIINLITLSVSSIIGLWLCYPMLRITLKPSGQEIKKVWDYGKYSLGGLVSYFVYSKADTFILSSFHGPVQVAVYNSVKVFTRIFDMVTQVVQMFVLPAASKLSSRGEFQSLKAMVEKAIAFLTIVMLPVFVALLGLASPMINIVYGGRYTEAIPLLQIFSALSILIPLMAVASNVLLGLGQARLSFILSVQFLIASVAIYFILIPLFGTTGAAIGYVLASVVLAWRSAALMNRFVPTTVGAVVRRTRDVKMFVLSRVMQQRSHDKGRDE
jgi:O-antigen/teichoic acid export membrane protein